jgi:hypothetical protein
MHGRRRAEHKALKRDPKIAEKLAKKALLWYQLQNELLTRRRTLMEGRGDGPTNKEEHQETLRLVENALSVNPDPLWLWNFRRELLCNDDDEYFFVWEAEAVVTQAALENNPKAYGAWHHRKWALRRQIIIMRTTFQQQQQPEGTTTTTTTTSSSSRAETLLASELALTAAFLQRDERNFHGWSYRRFVVSLLLLQHQQHKNNDVDGENDDYGSGIWQILDNENDLDDDDNKIDAGSMEHRKIVMGAQIGTTGGGAANQKKKEHETQPPHSNHDQQQQQQLKSSSSSVAVILEAEWDFTTQKIRDNFSNFSALHYRSQLLPILSSHKQSIAAELTDVVHNAICTEPDDQTAWWYQSFLLQYVASSSSEGGGGDGNNRRQLDDQVLDEHIRLLRELQEETDHQSKWVLLGLLRALSFCSSSNNNNETTNLTTTNREERRAILERLVSVDPDRKMRYRQLLRDLDEEKEETTTMKTMTN